MPSNTLGGYLVTLEGFMRSGVNLRGILCHDNGKGDFNRALATTNPKPILVTQVIA
jgi:hypothetical protein